MKDRFAITYLMRADLERRGYDISHVTDKDMERIASMMEDTYLECGFWEDLVAAADEFGVPKKTETLIVPADICGWMVKCVDNDLDDDVYYIGSSYPGSFGNDGIIYKNKEAFDNMEGICYVPEAGFMDEQYIPEHIRALIDDGKLSSLYVANDSAGYTYHDLEHEFYDRLPTSWVKEQEDKYGESVIDQFVDREIAYIFGELDYQCPSTFMDEFEWEEDWREFIKNKKPC